jgi:hypothetical protein
MAAATALLVETLRLSPAEAARLLSDGSTAPLIAAVQDALQARDTREATLKEALAKAENSLLNYGEGTVVEPTARARSVTRAFPLCFPRGRATQR